MELPLGTWQGLTYSKITVLLGLIEILEEIEGKARAGQWPAGKQELFEVSAAAARPGQTANILFGAVWDGLPAPGCPARLELSHGAAPAATGHSAAS